MGKIWKCLCMLLAGLMLRYTNLKVHKMKDHVRELNRQGEELEAVMASLGSGEAELHRNLAKWYNYNLELGTPGLEWTYENILNFGQGQMAVLGVPEWELKLSVYHGGRGAVSHVPSTPLPLGGQGKHTILHLAEIFPWTEGLSLYIDCPGLRLLYRVESIQVMGAGWSPERPTEGGQDLLTLVYDRGNTRTLIRCVRCSELVLRQREVKRIFPYSVRVTVLLTAASVCRLWIKCAGASVRKPKNYGFFHKNRGKTKLL